MLGTLHQISAVAFRYYGIDWIVTITVFISLFLVGDKNRTGLLLGMISAIFAFVFSFQIQSIANGVTALVLFILYLRGYIKWKTI